MSYLLFTDNMLQMSIALIESYRTLLKAIAMLLWGPKVLIIC